MKHAKAIVLACLPKKNKYEMSIIDNWSQIPMMICELHMTDKKQ
jgi:hypothetical protein